jgi:hypothetical protein
MAQPQTHDCFGSIVNAPALGAYHFVCGQCGKPFAVLDVNGLRQTSKHGSEKHDNTISLRALKVMIRAVENAKL